MVQQKGRVLLSYGCDVITQAGNQPDVVELVYTAAFAPLVRAGVPGSSKNSRKELPRRRANNP